MLLASSCYEDFEMEKQQQEIPDPTKYVINTTLTGVITDQNGESLHYGLMSNYGNANYTNESRSLFKLEGNNIDKYNEPLHVILNNQPYTFIIPAVENEINFTQKTIFTSKSMAIWGNQNTIDIESIINLSKNDNSFTNQGVAYNGDVTIYYNSIDQNNKFHNASIPGNHTGRTIEDVPQYLNFFRNNICRF